MSHSSDSDIISLLHSAAKQYLKILEPATSENEKAVSEALRYLTNQGQEICFATVEKIVKSEQQPPAVTDVNVEDVDLDSYDCLLECQEVLMI